MHNNLHLQREVSTGAFVPPNPSTCCFLRNVDNIVVQSTAKIAVVWRMGREFFFFLVRLFCSGKKKKWWRNAISGKTEIFLQHTSILFKRNRSGVIQKWLACLSGIIAQSFLCYSVNIGTTNPSNSLVHFQTSSWLRRAWRTKLCSKRVVELWNGVLLKRNEHNKWDSRIFAGRCFDLFLFGGKIPVHYVNGNSWAAIVETHFARVIGLFFSPVD